MSQMAKADPREEVRHLHSQGLTTRQIATLLNRSTQNVYKHLKALGLEPNKKAS